MDQHIAFFVAVIAVVFIIAWVIIAWYNYRLKKRIIESGPVNDEAMSFLKNLSGTGFESLKWGCIVFLGGLGLVVINFIPYNYGSSLPYGLEAMFIAAGFLIYYVLVRKQQKS
jgi:amino acid permease